MCLSYMTAPIAEDFPDIAQRLKEIEAQRKRLVEQPLPDAAAAALEQAYAYYAPDYDPA